MSEHDTKKRKLISGANATIVIAGAIGIAILVNAIASQFFGRIDLTDNQIYTLSAASQQAVEGLEEPVYVKAFISADLPPPHHDLAQVVADTLTEYEAASEGMLRWEIISPRDDAKDTESDAQSFGCNKVPIGQRSENEVSVRAVYKCLAFSQGEQLQVIENLQSDARSTLTSFEYEFTKALLNLRETEPRKLGFVSGFGGPADGSLFVEATQPVFDRIYGDLIELETVDLSGEAPQIGADISALVILNATERFTPQAIFALDQYIQRGGGVGWFQSATTADAKLEQQLRQADPGEQPPIARKPIESGLSEVFAAYGIEHNQDMLIDREQGVTSLTWTRRGAASITQPGTFMMSDLNPDLPFTQGMSALAMPLPSSLSLRTERLDSSEVEAHRVIQTAESTVRRPQATGTFRYENVIAAAPDEEQGKFLVAAALEGDIPSYYDEHELPKGTSQAELVTERAPSRILVVGSANFFTPMPEVGFNQRLAKLGMQFLLSSLEWLVQDTSLTQIRSKSMPRLVGDVSAERKRTLQLINIAAVPAIFALVGIGMAIRRRRRIALGEKIAA